MTGFDLLLRGGTVIDGTGAPARRADVGVLGDRILAVGDLGALDETGVEQILDVGGRVVAPGFIDPHGHSDGSVLVDAGLDSHLSQGFTTQLSGNCGESLAPITPAGRELVELALRPNGLTARWSTFLDYLDEVERQPLGINVAFLVGHGTIRGSVLGPDARPPTADELAAMVAPGGRGDGRRRDRPFERADLCARPARGRRGAPGAGRGQRAAWRALRDPHAQRGGRAVRRAR